MAAGYGFGSHIGFALESSGNTPIAAAFYVEALSENLALEKERFETRNMTGRYNNPDDTPGLQRVQGDVVMAADAQEIGHFLYGVMGVDSPTEIESGFLYTNRFTMRTDEWDQKFPQHPFTFEIFRDVTSAQQYSGVNFGALELNVAPSQELRATATLIGVSESQIAKTTPTYVTSPIDPFAFDTCSIGIAGVGTAIVEALTVRIDNQLEGVPTLNNSRFIEKIRRTGFQLITLSGTLSWEDIDEYNAFLDETERRWTANFFRADSFSLVIDMPRVLYTAFPLGVAGRERQTIDFEAEARFSVGSNLSISIDLTNTKSYYAV